MFAWSLPTSSEGYRPQLLSLVERCTKLFYYCGGTKRCGQAKGSARDVHASSKRFTYEELLAAEHMSILNTVNNLGLLYADQGEMKEAEEMLVRALRGFEEAWGPEHASTLDTVNNLGNLYADQGEMKEAEEMYLRAL